MSNDVTLGVSIVLCLKFVRLNTLRLCSIFHLQFTEREKLESSLPIPLSAAQMQFDFGDI